MKIHIKELIEKEGLKKAFQLYPEKVYKYYNTDFDTMFMHIYLSR